MSIETSFYFTQETFITSKLEMNRGTVVSWLKAFNHLTTEFVHNTFFCSFYGIDWQLTINYWSGNWMIFDPDDWFSQTTCLLIRRTCSTWLIFSDNLSPYQGNLFHLSNFLGHAVSLSGELVPLEWFSPTSYLLIRGTCSTWVFFPDKLSTLEEMTVPLECFSETSCHHMGK